MDEHTLYLINEINNHIKDAKMEPADKGTELAIAEVLIDVLADYRKSLRKEG